LEESNSANWLGIEKQREIQGISTVKEIQIIIPQRRTALNIEYNPTVLQGAEE